MMLKKFESLGTVLNRGQMKMVVGGVEDGGGYSCSCKCGNSNGTLDCGGNCGTAACFDLLYGSCGNSGASCQVY